MFIRILLKYMLGYVRITVEGYYIERFINICTNSKILIWNLKRENEVKLYLNIGIKDFYDVIKIAKKLKCKIKINKKRGIPFIIHKYKKRKIFFITLIVITMLIGVSTRFVWNIDIIAEEKIDNIEQDIKEVGLKIGVPKDRVNIQEIANKIRIKRDDISWIGIELKGTNAIVKIVKAKKAPEIINENENSNIVAYKEGIITKIIAQNGTALVKVGDEVKENQILIEGKIDGKYTGTRFVHSLGEVEALVKYSRTEKFPLKTIEKVETGNKETKYKIKISNFQINFYKTLSKFKIYDTIEMEKKIKIFSNLYLPISITKIINKEQENVEKEYSKEYAIETGTTKLEKILEDEIGKEKEIINKDVNIIETEKYIEVNVTYEVIENIGIQEREEILWKKEV
ncbi:MAG: sporulation protein YqfD [Clostridium sp. 26_21]|nr:MAG: sporulation protein YqfD [Clostridium sp. 26_21]